MIFKSLGDRMKILDIYKKTPSHLKNSTYSGAVISILAILLASILVISEAKVLLTYQNITEM
jgi:hypothetical protein